jgi:hypothetical protein
MHEVTVPIEARTVALDFESFFRAEYRSLCHALVLLVGDAFEAEEIAQETMTRVLERWTASAPWTRRPDTRTGRPSTFNTRGSDVWPSARSDGSPRSRSLISGPERATATTCAERFRSFPTACERR